MTALPKYDVPPPVMGPGDPWYDQWHSELQFFLDHRQALCEDQSLRSKYIALVNHEIVDIDTDEFALATRMAKARPNGLVFITKVELTSPAVNLPDMRFR